MAARVELDGPARLLLCDVMMPIMNGTLYEQIGALDPKLLSKPT